MLEPICDAQKSDVIYGVNVLNTQLFYSSLLPKYTSVISTSCENKALFQINTHCACFTRSPFLSSVSLPKLIKTSPTALMLQWKSRHPWTVSQEETRYEHRAQKHLNIHVTSFILIFAVIGELFLRVRKRRMRTSLWAWPGLTPPGRGWPTSSSFPSSFHCGSRYQTSGERCPTHALTMNSAVPSNCFLTIYLWCDSHVIGELKFVSCYFQTHFWSQFSLQLDLGSTSSFKYQRCSFRQHTQWCRTSCATCAQ